MKRERGDVDRFFRRQKGYKEKREEWSSAIN